MTDRSVTQNLRELWNYRVFLKYETIGRIRIRHKGTYLGFIWWILDPLIFLVIYYFVFGIIFKRGGENYVAFLFCALLPWRWFVTSVSEATMSIRSSGGLLKQIYFPKLIIPVTSLFTNTIAFFYGLFALAAILLIYRIHPGVNILYFPFIVVVQFAFSLGLGLILADLNVFMKDTGVLIRHILQMWFYMSPGIYSLDMLPARLRPYMLLNPFTTLFASYRDVLMFNRQPPIFPLLLILLLSIALIFLGTKLFSKHQGEYAKIL